MINRSGFAIRPGMRKGFTSRSPIPTRIVSNEEFPPPPQTPAQANVEHLTDLYAERAGPKLGLTRRHFLKTTGGMAAALLALNDVFGKFFDGGEAEMLDAAAFRSEEHTSELQSRENLVCRLLLEKKKK